ncbi:activator of mitotic machinery Cdc14 phosphatase activation C-term-domain-containing protein [Pilaira anomala]|nr:activator of mitotic machinery Cdc14 phosphatase activation C-term-domain-containing protein [Pilaira anomala]
MQLESTIPTSELIVGKKCNSEPFEAHQNDFILKNQQSTNLIWLPADKHPHISPNEFELWIKTHANETGSNVLIKTVTVQRKKSVLSMVSFLKEDSSDDDEEEEEEEDATPLTPPKEEFPIIPVVVEPPLGRQSLQIRAIQPNTKTSPIQIPEIEQLNNNNKRNKKHSWFTSLFHKPTKKTSPSLSSLPQKKAGLSGLFTKNNTSTISLTNSSSFTYPFDQKKKKKKEKKLYSTIPTPTPPPPPTPLVTRYPLDIERAVYQLSHIKLSNARRPLQQQVAISNMMYWYLSITQPMRKVVTTEQKTTAGTATTTTTTATTTATTTTTNTIPPASRRKEIEEAQRLTLSEVTTKSNKKKYKPVRNTEYMKK